MKSLLLCSRPPWPLHGGDRIRTWHLARALADLGEVSIVATRAAGESPEEIAAGLPFVARLRLPAMTRGGTAVRALAALPSDRPLQQAVYDGPAARRAVRDALADGPDVVVAHLIRTVPWLPPDTPPLVVDVQDALGAQYAAAAGRGHGWRRVAMAVERRRLGPAERAAIARSSAVTFISERDRLAVLPSSDRPWAILPAVLDPASFQPDESPPEPGLIGFVGQLRTAANRDMLEHFVRRVFPLVRSARRDARLHIVGRGADRELRRFGRIPGVVLVGAVDDVAPELRRCWLTICPQRFGSGVQNKVLQSLAVGTPAVVTPDVAAALAPSAGVAVGRLDRAFAMRVVELLGNEEERGRLSEAGIRHVRERHAPRALREALSGLLDRVVPAPRA